MPKHHMEAVEACGSFNMIQLKCPSFSIHVLFCVVSVPSFHLPENTAAFFDLKILCFLNPAFIIPRNILDEMINLIICFWHSDYPTL